MLLGAAADANSNTSWGSIDQSEWNIIIVWCECKMMNKKKKQKNWKSNEYTLKLHSHVLLNAQQDWEEFNL